VRFGAWESIVERVLSLLLGAMGLAVVPVCYIIGLVSGVVPSYHAQVAQESLAGAYCVCSSCQCSSHR